MDDADLAFEQTERELALALRQIRSGPRRPTVYDGTWCLICGEEIPAPRRFAPAGCCTCIGCQTELEGSVGR